MRPKVLLVDDQPLVLSVLKETLSYGPYTVVTAQNADAALQILGQESVDVVISDERMPGMQGSEFLAVVRRRYPDIVRIILTGHASVESAMKAVNQAEIYRLLTKPVGNQELHAAVQDALAHKARRCDATPHFSLLDELEAQAPGITTVRRSEDGAVIIEPDNE